MLHYLWIYICFFLGIFIEGELIYLSAVIATAHGSLNIWLVITIAITATMTSDVVYFNLGRKRAAHMMTKPTWKSKIEAVNRKLEKHRTLFLFGYRFIYGLRIATPLVLGTQNISQATFLKYSFLSTLLWIIIFTALGLGFGELILRYLKEFQHIEYYIIGGAIAVAVLFLIARYLKHKTIL